MLSTGLKEPPTPMPASLYTLPPLTILNNTVSCGVFRFQECSIALDLKWAPNIDTISKKAQQRLYFLCHFRKFHPLRSCRSCSIPPLFSPVLCSFITVRFG